MSKKYIDIYQIIKTKNPILFNKLSYTCIRILKKIIHERKINEILNKYSDKSGIEFLNCIQDEMNIHIEVVDISNLPQNQKCVFVANHPMGIADGLALTTTIANKYGVIKAIGNDAFSYIPQLSPFLVEVNVFGYKSRDSIIAMKKTYQSEKPITHFPAGLVSRMKGLKVYECEWQKSFITKAIEYQRDIVPIYFYGRNSIRFYIVYKLRTILKINSKIELILLPSEFFRKKNKTIKLKIGKPISYLDFTKENTHYEWAQIIKNKVNDLK